MTRKSRPEQPAAEKTETPEAAGPAPVPAETPAPPPPAETRPEASVEELRNRLLRLQADFENFRKRTLRERQELYGRANEDLVAALLDVLDHLELGLRAAREHAGSEPFAEGYQIVADQLFGVLDKFGLERMETVGRPFDPNLHEAISHLPDPDAAEGTVTDETRKGYLFGGRLLRAAQVVVSSGPPAGTPAPAGNGEAAAPESRPPRKPAEGR